LPARIKKTAKQLSDLVSNSLDELKAVDITVIDVKKLTTIADYMVICSGTSNRHLNALANTVVKAAKAADYPVLGIEGDNTGEWTLVDLDEVIVHIMLPRTRAFYNLESLWLNDEN
jgi:ribosome-associated protein